MTCVVGRCTTIGGNAAKGPRSRIGTFSTFEENGSSRIKVIEIRDSWRALRPYWPDNNTRADDDLTRLAMEAAWSLRAGLAAKSAAPTRPPHHHPAERSCNRRRVDG
jgi:hypothetical protein